MFLEEIKEHLNKILNLKINSQPNSVRISNNE